MGANEMRQLGARMSAQVQGVEFSRVIRFLGRRYPGFAEAAYKEFIEHVQPDFDDMPYEDVEHLHELSLEWAIFDKPLDGGSRVSRCIARRIPTGVETAT